MPDVPFTGMAIVHASVDFRAQAYPGDADDSRRRVGTTQDELLGGLRSTAWRRCDGDGPVGPGVLRLYASQKPAPIPDAFRTANRVVRRNLADRQRVAAGLVRRAATARRTSPTPTAFDEPRVGVRRALQESCPLPDDIQPGQ